MNNIDMDDFLGKLRETMNNEQIYIKDILEGELTRRQREIWDERYVEAVDMTHIVWDFIEEYFRGGKHE